MTPFPAEGRLAAESAERDRGLDTATRSATTTPAAPAQWSSAFAQLSPGVPRWVYDASWTGLRDAQEAAIPLLLGADRDVLISAATAGGKTEAAFLPIVSALETTRRPGRACRCSTSRPSKR